jgi:hypothetical protein
MAAGAVAGNVMMVLNVRMDFVYAPRCPAKRSGRNAVAGRMHAKIMFVAAIAVPAGTVMIMEFAYRTLAARIVPVKNAETMDAEELAENARKITNANRENVFLLQNAEIIHVIKMKIAQPVHRIVHVLMTLYVIMEHA